MLNSYAFHVQRQRILQLLEQRQAVGVTTAEISSPAIGGHEGPRRIRELREMGYPIQATPMPNGYWRYWLRQPGEAEPLNQPSLFE